jgi:hypothetical protein
MSAATPAAPEGSSVCNHAEHDAILVLDKIDKPLALEKPSIVDIFTEEYAVVRQMCADAPTLIPDVIVPDRAVPTYITLPTDHILVRASIHGCLPEGYEIVEPKLEWFDHTQLGSSTRRFVKLIALAVCLAAVGLARFSQAGVEAQAKVPVVPILSSERPVANAHPPNETT